MTFMHSLMPWEWPSLQLTGIRTTNHADMPFGHECCAGVCPLWPDRTSLYPRYRKRQRHRTKFGNGAMNVGSNARNESHERVVLKLLPFTLATFLGFLAIGVPLPVLPGQVHDALGFSTIIVGSVVGAQSLATLLTRQYAGRLCDSRGPKRTTLVGFGGASLSGLCYLASSAAASHPILGLGLLICGRLLLGFGESLFITGLAAWSIARVGPGYAGRAMAWQGIAMYGALAAGAPLGSFVEQSNGFPAVSACAVIFPVIGGFLVAQWADLPSTGSPQTSFLRVLRAIWAPGLGLALASSGFGTIAAFLALRYQSQGWSAPGTALTGFGVAYIAMRVFFGGLPDRIGGYRVAMLSLLVEAVGQLVIWGANSPVMALTGATMTGLGYSLVFPSLGVEAMRRVPQENRGLVIGAYLACFDVGLAAAGPVAGVAASMFGLPAAFMTAAAAAVLALTLTLMMSRRANTK
jgi:MFS family permease